MIKRTVLSHGTLIILLFFSLLLSANAVLPVSHVYNLLPMTASGQQVPGSEPTTSPTSPSSTAGATITPASEIGKTIRPQLNSFNEYRRYESNR